MILIIAVTILGIALAAVGVLWSATARHQRLIELQWVGAQYRDAIGDYYESSPGSLKVYPKGLDELLLDRRYLTIKRHIRALYPNPLTGELDWQPVRAPDGGIRGVEASSELQAGPLRFVYDPPIAGSR